MIMYVVETLLQKLPVIRAVVPIIQYYFFYLLVLQKKFYRTILLKF